MKGECNNMKKIALLALTTCALALGGFSAFRNADVVKEERDATIIVKMKTNVKNHSEAELLAAQNSLLNEISYTVTSNYKVLNRYSNIFNGFMIDVLDYIIAQGDRILSLNSDEEILKYFSFQF